MRRNTGDETDNHFSGRIPRQGIRLLDGQEHRGYSRCAPYEGQKKLHSLTFYNPVPDRASANDDLDFQLVWLEMLRERGVQITLSDFVDYWSKHLSSYPWNEYGFCMRNISRGLRPPISGCFENYYIDEMGSPIRSEIWACVAPGDPQLAASLAWMDSAMDHAGGEGTYGEMFWAAVESAAFVLSDPHTLIRIGLSMIPVWCRISRVIREAVWCYDNGVPWQEARERILFNFGHNQPCHAVQNHGFHRAGLAVRQRLRRQTLHCRKLWLRYRLHRRYAGFFAGHSGRHEEHPAGMDKTDRRRYRVAPLHARNRRPQDHC
jgi:hypothetical protein